METIVGGGSLFVRIGHKHVMVPDDAFGVNSAGDKLYVALSDVVRLYASNLFYDTCLKIVRSRAKPKSSMSGTRAMGANISR